MKIKKLWRLSRERYTRIVAAVQARCEHRNDPSQSRDIPEVEIIGREHEPRVTLKRANYTKLVRTTLRAAYSVVNFKTFDLSCRPTEDNRTSQQWQLWKSMKPEEKYQMEKKSYQA